MNRVEFMERLRELLADVPQAEKEEAIQYYSDYLNDAGAENEAAALAALGSPEQVADSIRRSLDEEKRRTSVPADGASGRSVRPAGRSTGEIILLILACIFLLPILIPLGLGAVIIAFTFLVCVIVFFGSLVIAGIVVLAVGAALAAFAVANLAAVPSSAVCILGGGLICVGIGLLITLFMCWLAVKTVPALCRGFVGLCSLPFHRKR